MRTKLLIIILSSLCSAFAFAQEPRFSWNAGVITEGQWNITKGKVAWANLISADAGVRLWEGAQFDLAAISTYGVNASAVDDRQDFSNINAPNFGFRLTHLGLGQTLADGKVLLFLGLRGADEDYCSTDYAGVFTGSSYGGLPTITENTGVPMFPVSALGFHVEYWPTARWTFRESLYNGRASDRLDEQFRFRPGRDGILNYGSAMYEVAKGESTPATYTLGYNLATRQASGERVDFGLWTVVEQPLFRIGRAQLGLLAQGAVQLTKNAAGKGYWAGAVVMEDVTANGGVLGLGVNRAYYADGNETDVELTFNCPIGAGFSVQPALHCIHTDGSTVMAGQLRVIYEIGSK